ncbi:hypothetical protein QJU89_03120 [Pasteurella skyensis]|uniref:Tetratricopeptide repeat-containing protein n=1 Tax=Phocoenobacter skyensis TaxID=97481 RepID=A0AAJ6NAM4_9PAST|nr:hypothetical protein [Pasteurella skyensis]MDP8163225.1 hypothetical protein [Pasteurella skyensis]MDP8173308.1 hypothetical protein [Pasteurella skyensis]MDP8176987.1 hypothetical protein [Pasteurella skyensis]MDP8179718.1 hypothetical protein [Pasteurella skyensis]MDP8182689.1 hypothetical protein [Pasteurella skyensis]
MDIEDKNFINYFLKKGDECLKQNKFEQAVEYYIKSVNSCSEISEVWCKLASLYKRTDNELAYQQAVINSILSNWSFGFPSQNVIRMLKSLRPLEEIKNHPLVIHRNNLDFKFGGTKENPNYHTMKKIIDGS